MREYRPSATKSSHRASRPALDRFSACRSVMCWSRKAHPKGGFSWTAQRHSLSQWQ
jgi:hypothetical protein